MSLRGQIVKAGSLNTVLYHFKTFNLHHQVFILLFQRFEKNTTYNLISNV